MNWALSDIAQHLNFHLEGGEVIQQIAIDSRSVQVGADTLFVAIIGARNDGHQYINEVYQKGVRCFVVKQDFDAAIYPEARFFAVDDTLKAFQLLAKVYREKFTIPTIGITGSNGKTIVKEWLYTCLKDDYVITRSPKSYNSQVGVPLSVFQINANTTLNIFEAGISMPNEMPQLNTIIQPTIGLITTIGAAHDEGFESREQKTQEKLKLFKGASTVIYCVDHLDVANQIHLSSSQKYLSWGKKGAISINKIGSKWRVVFGEQDAIIQLPFEQDIHVENTCHVIAILLSLGYELAEIEKRIQRLQPVKMRLSLLAGHYNSLIIDDSYSNDLPALDIALNFLKKHQQKREAVVVLSDILQSGVPDDELYKQVATHVNAVHAVEVVLVGEKIVKYARLFTGNAVCFSSSEEIITAYSFSKLRDKIVLFKGARMYQFEQLVKRLSSKVHETTLEINLDHIVGNLNYFKSLLLPKTKIMAMVKAYAYGSGYLEVANALQFQKIDYLAVAYVDEGVDLRKNGINVPIMVLNAEPENYDKLEQYNIEPEVFRIDQLKQYAELGTEGFNIHLKIDTGMHRLGFSLNEIPELLKMLETCPQLRVKSVFSHLSSADDPEEDAFTLKQIADFEAVALQIEQVLGYKPMKHILNSAGAQRFSSSQFDMVRLGIGLYGIGVETKHQKHLTEVGVLKSKVSQVRTVEAGESIGYNRRTKAQKIMKIATVAIGYADGYDRRFSNSTGKVFIEGEVRPVVGNVCMDMIMVDATDLNVKVGDDVEILGGHISWDKSAQTIGTISYELLTGIGERVRRVFYEGDLI